MSKIRKLNISNLKIKAWLHQTPTLGRFVSRFATITEYSFENFVSRKSHNMLCGVYKIDIL